MDVVSRYTESERGGNDMNKDGCEKLHLSQTWRVVIARVYLFMYLWMPRNAYNMIDYMRTCHVLAQPVLLLTTDKIEEHRACLVETMVDVLWPHWLGHRSTSPLIWIT